MEYGKLFGYLLGYPKCCIDAFCVTRTSGKVSYNGFMPCKEHVKLDRKDLEELVGRSFYDEPEEFCLFLKTKMRYEDGLRIYRKDPEFFKGCWIKAEND